MSLYDLSAAYRATLSDLEDAEGELSPELEARLDDLAGAFTDKAEAYCCLMAEMASQADALAKESERLRARSKTMTDNAGRLKERLKQAMVDTGQTKVKTRLWSISLAKGQPRVQLDDLTRLPARFFRAPAAPAPDKKAILIALKSGEDINGCALVTGEPSLRVR